MLGSSKNPVFPNKQLSKYAVAKCPAVGKALAQIN